MSANHVLLQEITLAASASAVTFKNIPQTGYTDLKVVVSGRGDTANTGYERRSFYVAPNGSLSNITSKLLFSGNPSSSTTWTSGAIGFFPTLGATSSVYGFAEIYFASYNSSDKKSYSAEVICDNNTTDLNKRTLTLFSGLWSDTSPITSLVFTMDSASFIAGSTFSLYGVATVDAVPSATPKATGGDIIVNDGEYWYHAFLSTGAFKPKSSFSCDYLVVAGGGGGAGTGNGANQAFPGGNGGGAGGVRSSVGVTGGGGALENALLVTPQNYIVTVGAGGVGTLGALNTSTNGSNSSFSSITSTGGGGTISYVGQNGGSGAGSNTNGSGGTGTSGQGYAGGGITGPGSGGGGGAGGAGTAGSGNNGGAGGTGVAIPSLAYPTNTGSSNYYAGGGGGGAYGFGSGSAGAAGTGGGGAGASGNNNGGAATANTGGGGGGASQTGTQQTTGGNGGSGIVIIRYAMA